MRRIYGEDTFIKRLVDSEIIVRRSRGWYRIPGMADTERRVFSRAWVLEHFGINEGPAKYRFNVEELERLVPGSVQALRRRVPLARAASAPVNRPRRTLYRDYYHASHSRYNIEELLGLIPYDADGVRRSYGIEYEINFLTASEESDLAYLLDTLPLHVTERDASLTHSGVEIVFAPMGKEDAIRTVNTLGEFVRTNDINMQDTGMHITYGVSNSTASKFDLDIRFNRLALAVAAVATARKIRETFGRTFSDAGSYARIPTSTIDDVRYRAFNVRNNTCWENRLVHWDCDINKVMDFFSATEFAFHRPFEAQDLIAVFNVLGATTTGA